MKAIIRLFGAVPIKNKGVKNEVNKELLKETVRRGFVFSPEVVLNYSEKELIKYIEIIEEEIGLTPEKLNQTFHKSWGKIKDASMVQLISEQIIHYITTYGFEELGIYDKDSVYIPNEKLEIPEITEDIKLVVIKGYTKDELKKKILDMCYSGMAFSSDTIDDIVSVSGFVNLNNDEIEKIKNREVKLRLYIDLQILPKSPVEFLRYVIYQITNKSLLIKNEGTINEIKCKVYQDISLHFKKYDEDYGLNKLSEIFYRYKPLFLAMKQAEDMKPIINKLRRLAKTNHKPMPEDYLNTITCRLKKGEIINTIKIEEELNKVNIFRKIRLACALQYRTNPQKSVLYKIRNGKSFAKSFSFHMQTGAFEVLSIVLKSITKDISKNVKGKKIYIPDNIKYSLPATEKQFTGNYPSGTYISAPKDMLIGIHWEDIEFHRVDLDLSLIGVGKIGWDVCYSNSDRTILFSGDLTDAPKPKGATEYMYVEKQEPSSHLVMVNYYNNHKDVQVPFKIIIGEEMVNNLNKDYVIDPNNVLSVVKTKMDKNEIQKVLGLLIVNSEECRFYFSESYLGKSSTSSNKFYVENAKEYLYNFYSNMICLNEILEKAGAKLVDTKEDCDIDLSELEKDTILNLLI